MVFQSNDKEHSAILVRTGLWTDNKVAIKRGRNQNWAKTGMDEGAK